MSVTTYWLTEEKKSASQNAEDKSVSICVDTRKHFDYCALYTVTDLK